MSYFNELVSKINKVFYAGNVGERSKVGSIISENDIEMVLSFLENNQAEKMPGIYINKKRSKEPFFVAMLHTDLKADVWDLYNFQSVSKYNTESIKSLPGECGEYKEIKFCADPNFEPFFSVGSLSNILLADGSDMGEVVDGVPPSREARCDVYPMVFCGKDAYVIGHDRTKHVKDWYQMKVEILNQNHIAVLEVACSAYPGYDQFYKFKYIPQYTVWAGQE